METHPLDDRGSFAWLAHPREFLARASAALRLDAGWLLVDPVDAPGLDEALAAVPVAGVTTLLARHRRDADAVAGRHGVTIGRPPGGVEERVVARLPRWREVALWLPDRSLLVCGEALGTAPYYLSAPGDPLGVHPLLRPVPPRRALAGLRPDAIAVGHGRPLATGATDGLEWALAAARGRLPVAWRHAVRVSRAARQER